MVGMSNGVRIFSSNPQEGSPSGRFVGKEIWDQECNRDARIIQVWAIMSYIDLLDKTKVSMSRVWCSPSVILSRLIYTVSLGLQLG